MKSYTIYFLRHGLTRGNLEGRYIGHTDLPLHSKGVEDLRSYQKLAPYPQAQAYFTSPLKRCKETLELIYPGQTCIEIPGLIEYNFGEFEGKTAKELEKVEAFSDWLRGDAHTAPPYGESNYEFTVRICDSFRKIVEGLMKTGVESAVICTHGGVIMALLAAFGLPEAPMHQWAVDAGWGYVCRITPGIWMRSNKMEVIDTLPKSMRDENEGNQ